jgi:hypothetical protein
VICHNDVAHYDTEFQAGTPGGVHLDGEALEVEVGLLDGDMNRQLADDLVDRLPLGLRSPQAALVVGEQLLHRPVVRRLMASASW